MAKTHDVERIFLPWLNWSGTEEVVALEALVGRELRRRGVARMKVYCAWCKKEGKPEAEALIGEKEPLGETTMTSHGLCGAHRQSVEDEIERLRQKIRVDAERQQQEAQRRQQEAETLRRQVDP